MLTIYCLMLSFSIGTFQHFVWYFFTRFLFSILFVLPAAAFTMIVAYGFGLARPGFFAAFDFAFAIAFAFAFGFAYFAFAVAFTVALPVRCVALLKLECSCSGAAALCALGTVTSVLSLPSLSSLSLLLTGSRSLCLCIHSLC